MLKKSHPDWGCERINDMLVHGPAPPANGTQYVTWRGKSKFSRELDRVPERLNLPRVFIVEGLG